MRNGLFAVLCTAVLSLPALAQDEPIQKTIRGQIDAFQVDDFARAFTFASPTIKQMRRSHGRTSMNQLACTRTYGGA